MTTTGREAAILPLPAKNDRGQPLSPRNRGEAAGRGPLAHRIFYAKVSGRRTLLSSVLLGAVALGGCGDGLHEFLNPYQLPVRGLIALPADAANQSGNRYQWTLNVGLLNDSELPELSVADAEPLLRQVSDRLQPLLPGIDVRFIIDQPMNSVFLIERSVRKKGFLGPKYDSDGPVLLLAPGPANADRNRARLRDYRYGPELRALGIAGVEQELASMDRAQQAGCLSEKLPASEYVWRAYLAGQVRYDLVLTNALVYPDDIRQRGLRATGADSGDSPDIGPEAAPQLR